MADSKDVPVRDSAEGRRMMVNLGQINSTIEAIAVLEKIEDANQPPQFIEVYKRQLDDPAPSASASVDYRPHIILSTGSGQKKAEAFFQNVLQPVLESMWPNENRRWNIHRTQSATSILDLIEKDLFQLANKGINLRIILASGDGGIVDIVNGFLAKPMSEDFIAPQVVLLPLGTANALYHSIHKGLNSENTWGLQNILSPTTQPLPVFTASFSPGSRLLTDEARSEGLLPADDHGNGRLHGAVVCSWGMHASLVADSDTTEFRKFGIDRFKMAAKEALHPSDGSPPHVYRATVSVLKGETWKMVKENQHMYVLVSMVSNLEETFCISPSSRPLDGSLHLVRFGPTTGEEAMRLMGLAYAGGKHVNDPVVQYEAVDGVRIAFEGMEDDGRWRRICVDGQIVRVDKEGWIELRKESKRVIDVAVSS